MVRKDLFQQLSQAEFKELAPILQAKGLPRAHEAQRVAREEPGFDTAVLGGDACDAASVSARSCPSPTNSLMCTHVRREKNCRVDCG